MSTPQKQNQRISTTSVFNLRVSEITKYDLVPLINKLNTSVPKSKLLTYMHNGVTYTCRVTLRGLDGPSHYILSLTELHHGDLKPFAKSKISLLLINTTYECYGELTPTPKVHALSTGALNTPEYLKGFKIGQQERQAKLDQDLTLMKIRTQTRDRQNDPHSAQEAIYGKNPLPEPISAQEALLGKPKGKPKTVADRLVEWL